MITDIKAYVFRFPVPVNAGDSLCVNNGGREVIRHVAEFDAEWTCSVVFKINGQANWLIGNQATIDWLKTLGPVEIHPQ